MRHQGFTLIELLIALVVLAVLIGIAMPSFSNLILSQRIKAASFDVVASLAYARSEAIKRNGSITITPVSGTNWADGWTIPDPDPSLPPLRTQAAFKNLTISGPASIVFGRSGRIVSTAGSILIDDSKSNAVALPRCITIDTTGIPRSKSGNC